MSKLFLMCLLCASFSACNVYRLDFNFADDRKFEGKILDQREDRFADIAPMALNEEIIAYMELHVTDRSTDLTIVDKLQSLLFDAAYLNIEYNDEVTRTAAQTFSDRKGNCLSVVNLYIAMARYFDVDAKFQTVEVRPSWDRRGEMLVLSQHINALGRFNSNTVYVVDFTPEITLQQLTADIINDREARALFFNNLGAENLITMNLEEAISYFKNALYLDPNLSIAWNNIGIAYSRLEDKETAEYAYNKAYSLDRSNATAINNLVRFYRQKGDMETSLRYAKAIERFNNNNPYFHYNLGNVAYADEDYEAARDHFAQAIKRKKSEPDFYLALSKTYEQMGDPVAAALQYERAIESLRIAGQIYLPSSNKVRIVDEDSILRPASAGFSVRVTPL
jgi:Flp pilus assembly protein TadD